MNEMKHCEKSFFRSVKFFFRSFQQLFFLSLVRILLGKGKWKKFLFLCRPFETFCKESNGQAMKFEFFFIICLKCFLNKVDTGKTRFVHANMTKNSERALKEINECQILKLTTLKTETKRDMKKLSKQKKI